MCTDLFTIWYLFHRQNRHRFSRSSLWQKFEKIYNLKLLLFCNEIIMLTATPTLSINWQQLLHFGVFIYPIINKVWIIPLKCNETLGVKIQQIQIMQFTLILDTNESCTTGFFFSFFVLNIHILHWDNYSRKCTPCCCKKYLPAQKKYTQRHFFLNLQHPYLTFLHMYQIWNWIVNLESLHF